MVNIQDVKEFACQVLNRDVWSNVLVRDLIQEHFILWQVKGFYILQQPRTERNGRTWCMPPQPPGKPNVLNDSTSSIFQDLRSERYFLVILKIDIFSCLCSPTRHNFFQDFIVKLDLNALWHVRCNIFGAKMQSQEQNNRKVAPLGHFREQEG